jgi:hypothetical protein
MATHKRISHLSEVPVDKIIAPEGSLFGGLRQRVGAHVVGGEGILRFGNEEVSVSTGTVNRSKQKTTYGIHFCLISKVVDVGFRPLFSFQIH